MPIEKRIPSFNVQIWCGLKNGYSGFEQRIEYVNYLVDQLIVDFGGDCMTVTPTNFRYLDGSENGVVIGYIQYPRFPRTETEIIERAIKVGEELMKNLRQNRVTITTPHESIMLKNDEQWT